jgi:hypothetical protein
MASLALLAETRESIRIRIAGDLRVAEIGNNKQTGET